MHGLALCRKAAPPSRHLKPLRPQKGVTCYSPKSVVNSNGNGARRQAEDSTDRTARRSQRQYRLYLK